MKIIDKIEQIPILETNRLVLRKFDINDAQDLYEYCKDPEVTKQLNFDSYQNIENAQDRIDYLRMKYSQDKLLCWAIVEKRSDKVIGSIDLFHISDNDKQAEVGYVINRTYWNNGYATEALKKVIDYGFSNLELSKICGYCCINNIGSQTVMENAGMIFESIVENEIKIKEKLYDAKKYCITDKQYFH